MELLHELDVDLPEGVSVGRDEVEAAVDARVDDALAVEAALALVEGGELVVDVLAAGLPAGAALEVVAEAGHVHHRQTELHPALLHLHRRLRDLRRAPDAVLQQEDKANMY